MSKEQPFNCEMPGCENYTSRGPHVCTKHFIEGWGRLPSMPLPKPTPTAPVNAAPLYVSDKRKKGKK